ncbi:MAG: hypothetical protein HGA19_16670 [Oscillochloris sp.]|nr:hypothetical protein [Oscillochloris sp.]
MSNPENQPEQQAPRWKQQAINVIETQIARYPLIVQLRAVWRQLQDERESWNYLIPLLLVVFIGTYRAERRKARQQGRQVRRGDSQPASEDVGVGAAFGFGDDVRGARLAIHPHRLGCDAVRDEHVLSEVVVEFARRLKVCALGVDHELSKPSQILVSTAMHLNPVRGSSTPSS